jgi:hypothetical protein
VLARCASSVRIDKSLYEWTRVHKACAPPLFHERTYGCSSVQYDVDGPFVSNSSAFRAYVDPLSLSSLPDAQWPAVLRKSKKTPLRTIEPSTTARTTFAFVGNPVRQQVTMTTLLTKRTVRREGQLNKNLTL